MNNNVNSAPIYFSITGRGFEVLNPIGPTKDSVGSIGSYDGVDTFAWGSGFKKNFIADELANKNFTAVFSTEDIFGNVYKMGTSVDSVTKTLGLSFTSPNTPQTPDIKVIENGIYSVTFKASQVGKYTLSQPKIPKGSISLFVRPGKPNPTKSSCSVTTNGPKILDRGMNVNITCSVIDQFQNPIKFESTKEDFGIDFNCKLYKIGANNTASEIPVASPSLISDNVFSCLYYTSYTGEYSLNGIINDNRAVSNTPISSVSSKFIVITIPSNLRNSKLYDFSTSSFKAAANSTINVINTLTFSIKLMLLL